MPTIKVIKPFGLRLGSGCERQDFGVGEHFITDEELGHWFVQACIKEGRAQLVPETVDADALSDREGGADEDAAPGADAEAPTGEAPAGEAAARDSEAGAETDSSEDSEETGVKQTPLTREELMALTVVQLKEVAAKCGVTLASIATKAVIVNALLAGEEGA